MKSLFYFLFSLSLVFAYSPPPSPNFSCENGYIVYTENNSTVSDWLNSYIEEKTAWTGNGVTQVYLTTFISVDPPTDNPDRTHGYLNTKIWTCYTDGSCDPGQIKIDGFCTDPNPDCDPQTSVIYNGVCTDCPPNSHPNSDQTYCDCDSGYSYNASSHSCSQCPPSTYYNSSTGTCDDADCALPFIPAPDYETSYRCILPDDDNGTDPGTDDGGDDDGGNDDGGNDDSCPHPPTLHDDPFVGIMSFDDCIFSDGWVFSCPDSNDVACYRSDSNNTDPDPNPDPNPDDDNNATGGIDSNDTDPGNSDLLDRERNSKLDSIIDRLDQSNKIAKENANAFASGVRNIGSKLDTIDDDLKTGFNSLNVGLGDRLDQIRDAISDQPTTDMTETNDLLKDIKDNQNPDLDIDTSNLDTAFGEAKTIFNDALLSFGTSANDFKSLITGTGLPTVSASGDCFLSGTASHIGSYRIDFSSLSLLRTGFQFLLNMFLLYLSIRLYTRIARDITGYLTSGL